MDIEEAVVSGFSIKSMTLAMAVIGLGFGAAAIAPRAAPVGAPDYAADGRLLYPQDYREWVYLSSGMDMSYVDAPQGSGLSMFDNVFANPEAYAAFKQTGTWPDKTVLVLEVRKAVQKGSINKHGHFQTDREGVEVHVKDVSRFNGGWAFFVFDNEGPGRLLPQSAPCYSCHQEHAAVDTTFVQFYPTLLPIARAKHTLSRGFLSEVDAPQSPPPAGQ